MSYKIVRFYQDGRPSKVIKTGQSLDEAQEHCTDEATQGDGWFDGYDKEDTYDVAATRRAQQEAHQSWRESL